MPWRLKIIQYYGLVDIDDSNFRHLFKTGAGRFKLMEIDSLAS